MKILNEHDLFEEKYRPSRIEDLIIPDTFKERLQINLKNNTLSHLGLWSKTPGTGKTSTANAIINELDGEVKFINASYDKGIDVVKSDIARFVSSKSFDGNGIKIVVFDEFDNFSPDGQKALRGFIEEFSGTCRFIFTGNYKENVLPAIVNRLDNYDFDSFERNDLIKPIFDRLSFILNNEKIQFDPKQLVPIINTFYPSIREMVKFIQKQAYNNVLAFSPNMLDDVSLNTEIINIIKQGNTQNIVQKCNEVKAVDAFYTNMYKNMQEFNYNPNAVVTLAKYQNMNSNVRDKNLNLAACCVEISNIIRK